MITTIKQILFTDKKKDGTALVNKAGLPFKMLHIELPDGKWISKYYSADDTMPDIKTGVEYDIRFKENGAYFNLIALFSLPGEGEEEGELLIG